MLKQHDDHNGTDREGEKATRHYNINCSFNGAELEDKEDNIDKDGSRLSSLPPEAISGSSMEDVDSLNTLFITM